MSPTRALVLFAIGCGSSNESPPPTPEGSKPEAPKPEAPKPKPPKPDGDVKSGHDDNDHPGPSGGSGTPGFGGRRQTTPRYLNVGKMEITGDYKEQVVRRHVRRKAIKLTECYTDALATTPNLAGTVSVRFKIDAEGKVASASASGLAKVDACCAEVIKTIEFPKPSSGTVEITYALAFAEPVKK